MTAEEKSLLNLLEDSPTSPAKPGQARIERAYRLDLQIGSPAMIRFGWGDEKNCMELQGEIVGYSHYEFLLIRVRPTPGILQRIHVGELLNVRFMNDGGAVIFQTELLGHLSRPGIILALAYPNVMNTVQVRKYKRVSCALPIIATQNGQKISGIISDISRGGCRLVMDLRGQSAAKNLEVGENIDMHAPLDLSKGLELIRTTIKNIETEQFRLIIGLSFEPMSSQAEQTLEAFLFNTEVLLNSDK